MRFELKASFDIQDPYEGSISISEIGINDKHEVDIEIVFIHDKNPMSKLIDIIITSSTLKDFFYKDINAKMELPLKINEYITNPVKSILDNCSDYQKCLKIVNGCIVFYCNSLD